MQSWQVLPIVLVVAAFAVSFKMRGKLGAKAAALYRDSMASFRAEVVRRADESEPVFIIATERKMFSAKLFHIALTDRRFVVKAADGGVQAFDRRMVDAKIRRKRFVDAGNMTTTYSTGWELGFQLPDGARHVCRVYAAADGIPEHPAHVEAFVAALTS